MIWICFGVRRALIGRLERVGGFLSLGALGESAEQPGTADLRSARLCQGEARGLGPQVSGRDSGPLIGALQTAIQKAGGATASRSGECREVIASRGSRRAAALDSSPGFPVI